MKEQQARVITLDREKIIKDWFARSQGYAVELTVFDRFISLWLSFNSWGTNRSNREGDKQMLEWVKNERNTSMGKLFREQCSVSQAFKASVTTLAQASIYDMRPRSEARKKSQKPTTDFKNFGNILDRIYLVRCNLFHGQKSPSDQNDLLLVKTSFEILSAWFKPIVDAL